MRIGDKMSMKKWFLISILIAAQTIIAQPLLKTSTVVKKSASGSQSVDLKNQLDLKFKTPNQAQKIQKMMNEGGVNGGGGDLTLAQPVEKWQFERFINDELPTLVKLFFNAADEGPKNGDMNEYYFNGRGTSDLSLVKSTGAKMYASSPTIFDILPTLQYKVQDLPCKDPMTNLDRDASINGQVVCFSFERLSLKLNSDNYKKNILAIASHEASHALNTTEDEAQFIESSVQLGVVITSRFRSQLYIQDLNVFYRNILSNISKIESNTYSAVKNCLIVQDIFKDSEVLYDHSNSIRNVGLRFYNSRTHMSEMVPTLIKFLNAKTYCNSVLDPAEVDKDDIFSQIMKPQEKALTMLQYIKRLPGSYSGPYEPLIQGTVRNLSQGDRAALIQELKEGSLILKNTFGF